MAATTPAISSSKRDLRAEETEVTLSSGVIDLLIMLGRESANILVNFQIITSKDEYGLYELGLWWANY